MRAIKFRGKDQESGEWLYGDLRQRLCYWPAIIESYCTDEGKVGYREVAVAEETVGQFTGSTDKNGREIYENDIIKTAFSSEPFGSIAWHLDGYFFIDTHFGKYDHTFNEYTPLGRLLTLRIDNRPIEIEVIGNIYDNPELINKEL